MSESSQPLLDAFGNPVHLFAPSANNPYGPNYSPTNTLAINVQSLGPLSNVDVNYVGTQNVYETSQQTNASGWMPVGPGLDGLQILPSLGTVTAPIYAFLNDANGAGVNVGYDFARWYALNALPAGCSLVVAPCGAGSSAMSTKWGASPAPGNGLFVRMVNAVKALNQTLPGVVVAAVAWHQGESDVGTDKTTYASELAGVVQAFRVAMGDASIPFLAGGLAQTHASVTNEVSIMQGIDSLPSLLSCTASVSSLGLKALQYTAMQGDDNGAASVHFSAYAQRLFAARYASAWCGLSACRGVNRALPCGCSPSIVDSHALTAPTILSYDCAVMNFTSVANSATAAFNAAAYALTLGNVTLLLSEYYVAPGGVVASIYLPYSTVNYAGMTGVTLPGLGPSYVFSAVLPAEEQLLPPGTELSTLLTTVPTLQVNIAPYAMAASTAVLAPLVYSSSTGLWTVGPASTATLASLAGMSCITPSITASHTATPAKSRTGTGTPSHVPPPPTPTPLAGLSMFPSRTSSASFTPSPSAPSASPSPSVSATPNRCVIQVRVARATLRLPTVAVNRPIAVVHTLPLPRDIICRTLNAAALRMGGLPRRSLL